MSGWNQAAFIGKVSEARLVAAGQAAEKKVLKSELGMRGKSLKRLGYSDFGFLIKFTQSKTGFHVHQVVHPSFHMKVGDSTVI